MKFANIDGIRCEATTSGQRGICPGCGSEVVAKCGRVKVNHWAHLSGKDCDSWHEPEKEWHRMWKNQFPLEWQEKDFVDKATGEHHRADVHTPHGLTIEFQHSAIKPEEREARENFYSSEGSMIWVVDGTRLESSWDRFIQNTICLHSIKGLPSYILQSQAPHAILPRDWLENSIPLFFDFLGTLSPNEVEIERIPLLCVLPPVPNAPEYTFFIIISREEFISLCKNGTCISWLQKQRNAIYNIVDQRWRETPTPPPIPEVSVIIRGQKFIVSPARPRKKFLYLP